uniref:Uncharacterized protein n=1 Tax=Schistocephalus solidus TaxID=70667 RepID=A0A0X3PGD3_SCHSO
MAATVGGTVKSLRELFENHERVRKNGIVSPPNYPQINTHATAEGFECCHNSNMRPSKAVQDIPVNDSQDTSCLCLNKENSETCYNNRLSNVLLTRNRSLSVDNVSDQPARRQQPPPVKKKPKIARNPIENGSTYSFSRPDGADSVASVTVTAAFQPATTWNASIASSSGVSSESADSTQECTGTASYNLSSVHYAAPEDLNRVSLSRNNIIFSTNLPSATLSAFLPGGSIRGTSNSKVQSVENIPFSNTILAPPVSKKTTATPINKSENVETRKPKKPPPVPKKPFSVRSGSAASVSSQPQYPYDNELEEKFGVKTKTGSYEYTEAWAALHGLVCNPKKEAHKKSVKTKNSVSAENNTSSEAQRHISVNSDSDLASTTSSTRALSLRSILKKKPSTGQRSNKSISFKDDDELTTNFNYPSERSLSEDSFEMSRLHFYDSDLGSDEEFVVNVGHKYWENPPSSSCSTLVSDKDTVKSSSTLRGRSSSRGVRPGSPTLEIGSSASNYSGSFKRFLPESRRPRLND